VALVVAAVVLVVLITSLRGIAGFYTDYLWFDSVGQSGVFSGVLQAKATLVALFTAGFFLLLWVNLLVVDRAAPTFRPVGPEDDVVARYRALVGGRTGLVRGGVALLFALIAGAGTSGQWQQWILFNNAVDFGVEDPQFGRDIGFYVFRLPFLSYVIGWLFASLVIIFIVTAVFHYLNGGIRVQAPGPERVTSQVKVHLSVLLGLLAIVKAAGYWLQRFELTVSTRGTVDGATYTDVNAQLPAINLLALIALASAVLFLLNIRRKGWVLPALGIGIWALVAVVGGAIVPAAVQRIRVEPAESSLERPFIERNIAATRAALGLDGVDQVNFQGEQELTGADLVDNAEIIRNIRLWDTDVIEDTYQSLQGLRAGYLIGDVDVDRYMIDGRLTQVMIAARELETSALAQTSWEARHLTFTHGYGVVVSPANAKDANGRPDFGVSEVPLNDQIGLGIEQPGIYIGEGQEGYVIVDTDRTEVDFQSDEETEFTSYDGADGVGIGSWVRRAAFALRFGDLNPLFSGNLRGDSRVLLMRDVRDRVEALAPFLTFDRDAYPVVVDGRISWVIDAYTTTSRYPYAQRAVVDGLEGSGLNSRFNYIRNPVKAVVDAYDGTVTFYVVDDSDPIIRAWQLAFPDLFSDEAPPPELVDHFRYPEDLFRVQTNMWGRYRVVNPDDFFNRVGAWTVARDPESPDQPVAPGVTTTTDPNDSPSEQDRIDPYFLLTRLPGQDEESFVQLRPYTPIQGDRRPVLTGFLVASSDPESYGQLTSYETPPTSQVDGPSVVAGQIRTEPAVSEDQNVLCRAGSGSTCNFGDLVFVPIEQGIIYVQPLYITAEATRFPILRKVIVEYAGNVGYADTLREALLQIFDEVPETLEEEGPSAPPDGGSGEEPPDGEAPDIPADAAALLDRAEQRFIEAEAALIEQGPAGFAEYARLIEEARELIADAQALLAGETAQDDADGDEGSEGGGGATSTTTTTGAVSTATGAEPDSA
jgi:uncharacterized membrane protein (UPF0182 family)